MGRVGKPGTLLPTSLLSFLVPPWVQIPTLPRPPGKILAFGFSPHPALLAGFLKESHLSVSEPPTSHL